MQESLPPPRWSLPVWGPRVRVSAGVVAWVLLAIGWLQVPAGEVKGPVLVFVAGLTASMGVHEGAHAWAAHSLGYRVDWVVVGGLTGVTAYAGRDDRPLERAAVALAGPAASAALVLGLVGMRLTMVPGTVEMALLELAIALNALAVVVNLVPIGRTDGALCVRGLVRHARGRRRDRTG